MFFWVTKSNSNNLQFEMAFAIALINNSGADISFLELEFSFEKVWLPGGGLSPV